MNTQKIYNIGTTVFYEGDDTNRGGFGKITDQVMDYTDDLQLEITLEDGRVISNVTPAEFEGRAVNGNVQVPEFHLVDTWETETRGWNNFEDEDVGYFEENSAVLYSL